MKHDAQERAALDAALARLGLDCSDKQKDLLLSHLKLVVEKNKELNLTRITSFDDAIVLHVEDSLSLFGNFRQDEGEFCDIGTGAGFPGLPLGIVSGRHGVLLDSLKKKAAAVQMFIQKLGLDSQLEACGMRSEELALERPASFQTVVARAVSSLAAVEELASPLLACKGHLLAMRGVESSDDEKMALRASEKLGLELVSAEKFTIGGGRYERSVYIFEKVGEPIVKLPRRPGMAQKRPYGK